MGDAGFPFLFHGTAPDDWFDEPVHAWLVRFVRDPSKAERAALAATWERASRDHARGLGADLSEPWLWNGGWALVRVRPGDRSRETMRALFAAMQSMLRAAHSAAPVAEVIYAQASDVSTGSEWEAWTVERSPVATEAPPWPAEVVTHMKRSRKRTKTSLDEAFEAARTRVRADLDAPRVAAVAPSVEPGDEPEEEEAPDEEGESGGEEGGDDDSGDDDSGDDDGEVTLPEPRGVPLRLAEISEEELDQRREAWEAKRPDAQTSETMPDGSWVFCPPSKKAKPAPLSLLADGEVIALGLPRERIYSVRAWSPERREMIVTSDDYRKLEAWGATDTVGREVWSDVARDSVNLVCWFADGAIAILHSRGVSVYPSAPVDLARGAHHAWLQEYTLLSPRRRAMVSTSSDGATVVRVTAYVSDALRIAGEVAVNTGGWGSLEWIDGGIYLLASEKHYRVEGIEEAVDALLAAPGDTTKFPELERIASPEEVADPTRNADPDDCYNRACNAKEEEDDANAERWYRRSVELKPANAMAWHGLGHVLQRMGREADAKVALERALAEYDAQIAAVSEDEDLDDLRFWRAAALSRLHRRDEVLTALRVIIAEGHQGNYMRQQVANEVDFEWLKSDADFKVLTAKVARPKRASKAKKGAKRDDDDEANDDE